MTTPQTIIDYWFGAVDPPSDTYQKRWFSGGDDTDTEIRHKFKKVHDNVVTGTQPLWLNQPLGRLASIIVIDQFSRNLYRGKADAFRWDHLALEWATLGWKQDIFNSLTLSQQLFSIMPLVHAEDLSSHELGLGILEQLIQSHPQPNEMLLSFYSSGKEHHDIIAKFGRYPHRNSVLGRASTEAEIAYLDSGARRFGQ